MSLRATTSGTLRLVPGGAPADTAPGGDPDRPVPRRIAEDLRAPLREAEKRIGFVLSGELGPIADSQRLALGSARECLADAESLIDLLGRAGEPREEERRERFDLRFALRDVLEEARPAARAKGIRIVLRLPESPAPVRALRSGTIRTLRFTLRELIRGAPPRSRLSIRLERRAGRTELTVRNGAEKRPAPPCASGLALARAYLRGEGGNLVITEGGACWTVALPEPRKPRRRSFPTSPPARPVTV